MDKTIIEYLVDGFRKAANELEELQVQLALGKAEAKDKFESLKKNFNGLVHSAELKVDEAKDFAQEMRVKFEELRVQLALGKAETLEAFEAQRKKINQKMQEIEQYIKEHPTLSKVYDYLVYEFERIKTELEILAINFKLALKKTDDSLQKRREEMAKIIQNLQSGLEKHLHTPEPTRHENFRNEIKQAYHHLKAAFS
ncbi:MAG: hypothetical protein IPH66_15765 [Crocinitomicaceae bacterium]|nr:hypothetical protein [Crocinitomicaceae bacterium]